MTIARPGSVSPIGDTDARIVENVPANKIAWTRTTSSRPSPVPPAAATSTIQIPTSAQRTPTRRCPTSSSRPETQRRSTLTPDARAATSFATTDRQVTVHNFNDVGGVAYQSTTRSYANCTAERVLSHGAGDSIRSRSRSGSTDRRSSSRPISPRTSRSRSCPNGSGAHTCTAARRTPRRCAATADR